METYLEFLKSKIVLAKESGFDIDPGEINPALKPHQRDSVIWALRGGRRDKQIEDMKQGMAQLAKAVAVKEEAE